MRKIFLLCAVIFTLTLGPGALHASIVFSENFDGLTQKLNVTSVGGFTAINGTNVDVVGVGFYGLCNGPESGNCIDLEGTGGNPQGQLQSNMIFGPGTYVLSFDLIGEQRGFDSSSVTVILGNYDQTFTLTSYDFTNGIVTNVPVTVATPSQLSFISNGSGDAGILLDNVQVSGALSGIPEPSSQMMMGATLIGASAWAVRRRRPISRLVA
jgi:hypothetical protein